MNNIIVGSFWVENEGTEMVRVLWNKGLKVVVEDEFGFRCKMSKKKFRRFFSAVA